MARNSKGKSLSPDFQSGMLVGHAEGLIVMQLLLIKAVKDTASTAPGTSAFLKAFAEGIGKNFLKIMAAYHEEKASPYRSTSPS